MKHLLKIGCLVVFMLIFVSSAFAGGEMLQTPAVYADVGEEIVCLLRNTHEEDPMDVKISIFKNNAQINYAVTFDLEAGAATSFHTLTSSTVGSYYCNFEIPREMDYHVLTTICSSNYGCVSGFKRK